VENKNYRSKLINKLCFGTANLTNNYGILKKKKNFHQKKLKKYFMYLVKIKLQALILQFHIKMLKKKLASLI